MNEHEVCQEDSIALRTILGGPTNVFFEEVWQKACGLYTKTCVADDDDSTHHCSPCQFDLRKVTEFPVQELLRNGMSSLTHLLENARQRYENPTPDSVPLLFRDRQNVSPDPYQQSLFHAYLDGCSVVINHADEVCPYLAALCLDFQKSFPHAYANTYLTPPQSQTVPPHADDRDVFVLQIYGEKHWKVYKRIPVPYPYPHEQVGKDGLDVPQEVLQGGVMIDFTLKPGHVLYMPRGYVHEAANSSSSSTPSYHATIALATHDWTLAGLMTNATQHILTRIISNRMALPLHLGRWQQHEEAATRTSCIDDVLALQEQLDDAWEELKRSITAENLISNFAHRCNKHNARVLPIRNLIMKNAVAMNNGKTTNNVVGRTAAASIRLSTIIRAATPEEKASVDANSNSSDPRGLHVREAIADDILQILSRLKHQDGFTCRVENLRTLVDSNTETPLVVCDLTLLSFAKTCVELGALAVVQG